MPLFSIPIIVFILIVSAILVVFFISIRSQKILLNALHTELNANELLINEQQARIIAQQDLIEQQISRQDKELLESEQISKQLEHRIKTLQQQFARQSEQINQLQSQQPEDKLYSRALKLVQLGADIQEVMRECDIPQAEAEMLMAVHHKK